MLVVEVGECLVPADLLDVRDRLLHHRGGLGGRALGLVLREAGCGNKSEHQCREGGMKQSFHCVLPWLLLRTNSPGYRAKFTSISTIRPALPVLKRHCDSVLTTARSKTRRGCDSRTSTRVTSPEPSIVMRAFTVPLSTPAAAASRGNSGSTFETTVASPA